MATRNRLASEAETEDVNALRARISPGTQLGASVAGLAAPAANARIAGAPAAPQGVLMEDLARLATDRFADQFAALGWTGPTMVPTGRMVEQYTGSDNPTMVEEMAVSPEFAKFVQDQGISTSLNDMGFGTSDITLTKDGQPLETYSSRLSGFEKAMNPIMDYGVPLFLSYLTGQAIGGLAGAAGDLSSLPGSGANNALASSLNPADILASPLPELAAAPLPAASTIAPGLGSAADLASMAGSGAGNALAAPRLTPAALESAIGTPGYGTNAAAAASGITPSAGFAGMSPTNFGMSGAQTAAYDAAIAAGAAPEAALSAANAAPVLGSPAATAATAAAAPAAATGATAVTNPYQFIIPAAANIVGAAIGAQSTRSATEAANASATRAAELQYQAQKEALDLQKRMYEENVARQQPYYQAGVNALSQMAGRTGAMPPAFQYRPEQLTTDPGYGFRLSEGLKALERSAAARGGLLSGGTGKALTRFGQEMGSQEFGNAYNRALTEYNALRQRESEEYNRLAGLAGVGGTTAQQLGQAGQSYGQQTGNLLTGTAANVGNLLTQQGQTAANAAIARGSLYGRGLSDIGYLAGQYYGRPPGP